MLQSKVQTTSPRNNQYSTFISSCTAKMNSQIFFVVFTLLTLSVIVYSIPLNNRSDLYTAAERAALKKFRTIIGDKLPHEYMNADSYLINWVRNSHTGGVRLNQNATSYSYSIGPAYDLKQAAKNLEKTLAWRKENRIDEVLSENFSDLEKAYPFDLTRVDKSGRPVFTFDYATWDIKKGTEEKDQTRFVRYLDYMLERGAEKARELKTSDYTYLVDVSAWNKEKHGCQKCLELYPYFLQRLETHYPQMTKNFLQVNAPAEFEGSRKLVEQNLPPSAGVKTWGNNTEEWLPEVGKIIAPEQIPVQFIDKTPSTTTTTPKPTKFIWFNSCAGCGVSKKEY